MIIHHVYFWLKESLSEDDKAKFVRGLRSLAEIDALKMSDIGVPAGTDRAVIDSSYSYSWLTIFDSMANHDVYQEHPVHLKFVEDCAHLWDRVLIFDSVSA